MHRKKLNNSFYISFILLILSLMVTPYYIRGIILPYKVKNLNVLAYLSILLMIFCSNKKYNRKYIFYLGIITTVFLYSQFYSNKELLSTIKYYLGLIVPLYLLGINIDEHDIKKFFLGFIKVYNIFIFLLLLLGVIDFFTGNSVAKFWSSIFNDTGYTSWAYEVNRNRYLSFMGHPLYNSELFLIFFVFNSINNKYFEKQLSSLTITLLSVIGIALTGSKTGMVLVLVGILIMSLYSIKTTIIQWLIFLLTLFLGVFETTINRFKTQTLTTGRSKYWNIVESYNLFPIKFWNGYGAGFTFDYNSYINNASAAFEYPIRMFSLEFGILFTILLYISIFFLPILCLIKRKHFYLLIGYLIIFIDVNTYNGIALAQDHMFILVITIFLIIKLSNYLIINADQRRK